MKKIAAFLLVLCLLIPPLALAEVVYFRTAERDDQYAIIYSPILSDRLNLREIPSQSSASAGRYYTGTVVRIGEKGEEWSSVYIGKTAIQYGFMKNDYLIFFDDRDDVYRAIHGYETEVFRAELKQGAKLYLSYLSPGDPVRIHPGGEDFIVLGDVNDDWLHVQQGRETYFVKQQDVVRRYTYGMAVVTSDRPEDRLNLRAAPESDAKVLGKLYAGTLLSVQRLVNGYAEVQLMGEGRNCYVPFEGDGFDYQLGYVKEEFLRWGKRADLIGVEGYLRIAEVKNETAATYKATDPSIVRHTLTRGMRMQLLGMQGTSDYLYVDLGESEPVLIKSSDVRILDAVTTDGLPVLGYGIVSDAADLMQAFGHVPYYTDCFGEEWAYACCEGDTVEILALSGQWAQIRYWGQEGFMPRQYLDLYMREDLLSAEGGKQDGLFTFTHTGNGTLHLRYADGTERTFSGAAGEYTLFIPEGTAVTLEGGTLSHAKLHVEFITPSSPVFRGSGRYLAGAQCTSRRKWSYVITPLDPEKEAWYSISTFDLDRKGEAAQRIVLDPDTQLSEDELAVSIEDGEFLEFHNCIVEIFYGNG